MTKAARNHLRWVAAYKVFAFLFLALAVGRAAGGVTDFYFYAFLGLCLVAIIVGIIHEVLARELERKITWGE